MHLHISEKKMTGFWGFLKVILMLKHKKSCSEIENYNVSL